MSQHPVNPITTPIATTITLVTEQLREEAPGVSFFIKQLYAHGRTFYELTSQHRRFLFCNTRADTIHALAQWLRETNEHAREESISTHT
jgi:hypothetical protein